MISQKQAKPRFDGKGDGWALAHRNLGSEFHMHDLDAVVGEITFARNTGERLFLEYVPDNYVNHEQCVRDFALVAMFDRKSSKEFALGVNNSLSTALYLWICRKLSEDQPVAAKFFYVIGGQTPPWTMVELDIITGKPTGAEAVIHSVQREEWLKIWDALGLRRIRSQLRKWIDPICAAK